MNTQEVKKLDSAVITVAIFLLVQTITAVWWASSLTASVSFIREGIVAQTQTLAGKYDRSEAAELKVRVDRIEKEMFYKDKIK